MFTLLSQIKAKHLMRTDPLSLTEEKPVTEAVALMNKANRGCVVITNKRGELSGVFTERDLLRRVVARGLDPKKIPVGEVMTPKVIHAKENDEAILLLETMCEHNFRHVPVLKDKKLVGLITLKQFFKFFLEKQRSLGV